MGHQSPSYHNVLDHPSLHCPSPPGCAIYGIIRENGAYLKRNILNLWLTILLLRAIAKQARRRVVREICVAHLSEYSRITATFDRSMITDYTLLSTADSVTLTAAFLRARLPLPTLYRESTDLPALIHTPVSTDTSR